MAPPSHWSRGWQAIPTGAKLQTAESTRVRRLSVQQTETEDLACFKRVAGLCDRDVRDECMLLPHYLFNMKSNKSYEMSKNTSVYIDIKLIQIWLN